ncbi:hypothetical protein S40285_02175 [Stachybotrys chlorohalonatus IBT 40285]|uniref:very-long-chain enoyl-CoA reductase n=1 Tax=Stachybotrys chlorohalonatus (strain IBT 40285) TaxID=1283841 RepID=A0A084QB39_STAC4|nr:hypothetical protein S40285_02175 [Stachybotrys chlorohalonata IBT 40285]
MASSTTLKLSHRSPRQPIKNLPPTVDVDPSTTVEDLKILIAKKAGISDHNRIGIFDTKTKKTLKDRKARLANEEAVVSSGEVLVKDLGMQVGWRLTYFIEYLGPLAIHAAFVAGRSSIYKNGSSPMSSSQWLAFAMFMGHFLKREFETLFIHKFSANTMPLRNIFKNCGHYWALSGLLSAYFVYSPTSLAATANPAAIDAVATALFLFGEVGNALVHLYLASLRSAGGTERKIPVGYGFNLVTCPNYMYEIVAWLGVIAVTRSWAVVVFIVVGAVQMYAWAKGKERAYRTEFGERYKKKRYVILPGLA